MKKLVLGLVLVCLGAGYCEENEEWWRTMSLYQVYPRSFKDSDGDGVGDLRGIASRLEHLSASNVDAFWLSPIYPSPMVDFGYDISDFTNIEPLFGTMEDFDELLKSAHELGLKVLLDFVPNHSSDQHVWFQKSLKMIEPYTDYYVWNKGKTLDNGTVVPPNNWVSLFGGSAWTWDEGRQAYYLHQFARQQPDLNYENENVVREMKDVMRFWLRKGIDGFRMDALPYICEDTRWLDEPIAGVTSNPNSPDYTEKIYTKDQLRSYEILSGWRDTLDEFSKPGSEKVMVVEAYANFSMTMKYYESGAHFPFNFDFIGAVNKESSAADFQRVINRWMSGMPPNSTPNWVAGNHDNPRLVTRFGLQRAQAVTAMVLLLPGVGVTYYGEEIGMTDTWISYEDTQDPQGRNAGKDDYESVTRDPIRTPFQWNDSTSAGFSVNNHTWLPVNNNYKQVNLAAEKSQDESYYALYSALSALRKSAPIRKGKLTTKLLNENVLAVARETEKDGCVYVIINFSNNAENVDLSGLSDANKGLRLYSSNIGSGIKPGTPVEDIKNIQVPSEATLVYIDKNVVQ